MRKREMTGSTMFLLLPFLKRKSEIGKRKTMSFKEEIA